MKKMLIIAILLLSCTEMIYGTKKNNADKKEIKKTDLLPKTNNQRLIMPAIMHRRLNIPLLINPNAISNSSQNNLTEVPQVYKQGNYRRKLVLSML